MTDGSSLHVGYLVQQFPPEVGAGPARVLEMALRWRERGAQVTVVTGMPNRPQGRIHPDYRGKLFVEEEHLGIRVLRSWLFARPGGGFATTLLNNATFMATAAVHALARAGGVDVLVASSPPFFPHLAGAMVQRLRGIPLVLEIRDLWPDYLAEMGTIRSRHALRALFAVERGLLRRARRVVVVTESFRRRVIAKGVEPERVDVVSNGVDTALYYPAEEPPPLPSLHRAEGERVVGYLGNFGVSQDLAQLLEAAAILERRDPGIRFVLAGDGPARAQVEARARALRLSRTTIEPPVPKEATRAFYNACDLCLVPLAPFPVLGETIPSKLFEVMACERPVVASLRGEGARVVEESGCGAVVSPGDAPALAEAILRMFALPPAERRRMGAAGRRHVSERFAREVLAARYLELLERAADRGTGRG